MITDNEIVDFEKFYREGRKQLKGLREKYGRTKDKIYRQAISEVKSIMRKAKRLEDFIVPVITEDNQLGFIEYSSKEKARENYYDAMKERLFTYV